jgi:hypothetical protein
MGTPTNPVFTELRHEGGYVVWDPSDGMLTREAITLISGSGVCTSGLVLGAELTAGAGVATALGANTGNGTFSAITVTTPAVIGNYVVEFDDPTHFVVNDPSGVEVGHGVVGAAFAAGGLGFTITAGGTAFAPADSFTVTVTGTVKYGPSIPLPPRDCRTLPRSCGAVFVMRHPQIAGRWPTRPDEGPGGRADLGRQRHHRASADHRAGPLGQARHPQRRPGGRGAALPPQLRHRAANRLRGASACAPSARLIRRMRTPGIKGATDRPVAPD